MASRSPTSISRCSTGPARPSAISSTTSTRCRTGCCPSSRDRPLSVIRVHRGQEPFMQKNVPKYTPEWVPHGAPVGRGVEARGRRTRCATTGERCCGSPTSAPSSTTRRSCAGIVRPGDAPRARPRPAGGQRLPGRGRRRPARTAGADRRRPRLGGEDERREGAPRVRADRRRTDARGDRGGDEGDRVTRRGPGP